MSNTSFNSAENQTKCLVRQINRLISNDEGIKPENKIKMQDLLQQVDFVLGKYSVIYESLTEVLGAMAVHDFSKRILPIGIDNDFIGFLTLGLNLVNEQLSKISIRKQVVHRVIDVMNVKNLIIIIANTKGEIYSSPNIHLSI
jgi:hypothetical protein